VKPSGVWRICSVPRYWLRVQRQDCSQYIHLLGCWGVRGLVESGF
jgi:hypothetical protein